MTDITQSLRMLELMHNLPTEVERVANEAADEIDRLRAEVAGLRDWIRSTGLQADICTRNILGEICPYCQCKHARKAKP